MATKKPTVIIPPMVRTGGLQAPTRTIHGGVTGQKMQPIPTSKGGQGGGDKSGGGNSK